MPELKMPRNEFVDAVRNASEKKINFLTVEEVAELTKKYNQEKIADGAECVVIPGENTGRDTVAAFLYKDMPPLRAKVIFYTQRILSTLFPKNFPHFYAAFGKNHDATKPTGTIRERKYTSSTPVRYPFTEVQKVSSTLNLNFDYDEDKRNFLIADDGGQYYLDTTETGNPKELNTQKILEYMRQNNFSETEMKTVETAIQRLVELCNVF